jgi:hypothetical protein
MTSPTPRTHSLPRYTIRKLAHLPNPQDGIDAPTWNPTQVLQFSFVFPESSSHHPLTHVRVGWTEEELTGIFEVQDRYVRCLHTGFQEEVWQDACVEFFCGLENQGYINFEMNCAGGLLCYHIIDATRSDTGFRNFRKLTQEDRQWIRIYPTLAGKIDPEIGESVVWSLHFSVHRDLWLKYLGQFGGSGWRGNFYKCAENNSHPHWISWAPIPTLNFHSPDYFGYFEFE